MSLPTDVRPSGPPDRTGAGVEIWSIIGPGTASDVRLLYFVRTRSDGSESAHAHGSHASLAIIDDGTAIFSVGGEEKTVTKGDVVWSPVGVPHSTKVISDHLRMWLVVFSDDDSGVSHEHGHAHDEHGHGSAWLARWRDRRRRPRP